MYVVRVTWSNRSVTEERHKTLAKAKAAEKFYCGYGAAEFIIIAWEA